ncbi:MAG: nucleoside-diphosphate kinase [Candidatus Stygibacter australis]|nr:nucleoside-diphosphate kinase [Candidatus Stygibacter australis]MDP8322128.1 nucleoside-diphosphate kinase [Candidatus Stygibacter australis]
MDKSLLLIKPNATKRNLIGAIIKMLEDNRFHIAHLKSFNMSDELAQAFYAEHHGKGFYENLVSFMKSGTIIGIVVKKDNAIENLRILVGKTNPAEADPGTIRYLYGESVSLNSVHASDSPKSAVREIKLIFPEL